MKYLKNLVEQNGDELRHYTQGIKENEQTVSVFDYSVKHGGTFDSFKFYNDYFIVIKGNKMTGLNKLYSDLMALNAAAWNYTKASGHNITGFISLLEAAEEKINDIIKQN